MGSHRELFVERYSHLAGLAAHCIYILPEYINGGEGDPFAAAEPWYAVNPIVRELGQFKAAFPSSEAFSPHPSFPFPPRDRCNRFWLDFPEVRQ